MGRVSITDLIEAGVLQSFAQRVAHASQLGDRLVAHRLCHKVPVLLRCARHDLMRVGGLELQIGERSTTQN